MNTPLRFALIIAIAASLPGCATEEDQRRRDAERAREEARENFERAKENERYEREERQRDRERDEEDFQDFLEDYAYNLRKTKSELTASQRAAARRDFESRSRSRSYRYWY